jgi:hypothetical protein
MTEWKRLGIGGPSPGFLSGRLSPSAAPKRDGDLQPVALLGKGQSEQAELAHLGQGRPPG